MEKNKNILVVDDSQELTTVIADFLEMFGYSVSTAGDGVDALDQLDTRNTNIIVSDINMPRMDGLSLMTEVKRRYPDLPVVIITGFSVSEARKIAIEQGADAFVAKPFHLRELKEVIDSVCDRPQVTEH